MPRKKGPTKKPGSIPPAPAIATHRSPAIATSAPAIATRYDAAAELEARSGDPSPPPAPAAAPAGPPGSAAPLVETSPARFPWRAPARDAYLGRHVDVALSENQAYVLAGLVAGIVPPGVGGEPATLMTLANGRAVSAGPSARTDTVRWLLEAIGRALGPAPQTTHPARLRERAERERAADV